MKLQIITIIMALLLVACSGEKADPFVIGGVFHLTGPGAFWGEGERNGALLAIEELQKQGIEINMIIEDGNTDFKTTVTALHKLIDINEVPIIVGPTWFGQVASPVADEKEVVIISPSAGTVPKPNKYFFDLWPTERQEILPEIEHMRKKGVTDIVIVYSINDWSQSMKDVFVSEAQGIDILKVFGTNPDEKDFRTILLQIKKLNPDAIYAPFAFYPSQGEFSKQARLMGLDIPIYSSSGTENPQLVSAYPEIEGTIYPYPDKGYGEGNFEEKYVKRFGIPASPASAYAYDAVMLIAQAYQVGKTSSDDVSDFLRGVKEYQGISNIINFDKNGRVKEKNHIMKIVKNGNFSMLSYDTSLD